MTSTVLSYNPHAGWCGIGNQASSWLVSKRASCHTQADKSAAFPAGIVGAVSTSNSHPSGEVVTPLRFPNNQPVRDLHALIENWDKVKDHLVPGTPVEAVESVTVLAPLRGRDVLCVGYNYRNHRMEFQSTGFDESVKLDYPEKPGTSASSSSRTSTCPFSPPRPRPSDLSHLYETSDGHRPDRRGDLPSPESHQRARLRGRAGDHHR
jgi:hypothetical protein